MEATGDTGSISPSQPKENSTDSEQEQTTSQKDATSISSELKEDAVQSESNEIRLLNFAKSEFNKNRKIIIRNVPPVTYDVRISHFFSLFMYYFQLGAMYLCLSFLYCQ